MMGFLNFNWKFPGGSKDADENFEACGNFMGIAPSALPEIPLVIQASMTSYAGLIRLCVS
jgi:hypothetical protein